MQMPEIIEATEGISTYQITNITLAHPSWAAAEVAAETGIKLAIMHSRLRDSTRAIKEAINNAAI